MPKKATSPTSYVLDDYEQELENALEKSYSKKKLTLRDKADWAKVAQKHVELQKSKRITLSVNTGELVRFKAKAKASGIPYQTLLNLIIKQFNEGDVAVSL
ncbi:MAG TPA: plasmid partition protein ParG [Patescibacteria group bacterium]